MIYFSRSTGFDTHICEIVAYDDSCECKTLHAYSSNVHCDPVTLTYFSRSIDFTINLSLSLQA